MQSGNLLGTNKVAFYIDRMAARGFNGAQILEGTGLQSEDVLDPLFRASPKEYTTIIGNIIRLTGDPHIGIALGEEFSISHFGALGYAVLSSSTVGQARDILKKYSVLREHIINNLSTTFDNQWRLEIDEAFPLGPLISFAVEEFASRACQLMKCLTNEEGLILSMHLSYPQPQDLSIYAKKFRCQFLFNQPKNIIFFNAEELNRPISFANEGVLKICEEQCLLLTNQIAEQDHLSGIIRKTLINSPGKFPKMDELSSILNINSRTIRRKLKEEGTTYLQIIDQIRRDLAIQYLDYTALTPKEIGFLLGFNSVSNFRRAFKNWTGKKLSDYRQGIRLSSPKPDF